MARFSVWFLFQPLGQTAAKAHLGFHFSCPLQPQKQQALLSLVVWLGMVSQIYRLQEPEVQIQIQIQSTNLGIPEPKFPFGEY